MDWKKDKDYYYFIFYREAPGVFSGYFGLAIVTGLRDETDRLFPGIKIKKILHKPFSDALGSPKRIKEGAEISANELQGVGGSGPEEYIFPTAKGVFDKIFNK